MSGWHSVRDGEWRRVLREAETQRHGLMVLRKSDASGYAWAAFVGGESGLGEAATPANAKAAADAWVRDFALGLLREVGARDDGAILVAIRDALGCEPGGEVEAVQAAVNGCDEWERLNNLLSRELAAECRRLGVVAPRPGDTLTPDDFGRDEAGVLRLAALLSEAPEGAVVRCGDGRRTWINRGAGEWTTRHPESKRCDGMTGPQWLADNGPLTVVAWPS